MHSATCQKCKSEIFIHRWAVKATTQMGKVKGKEIKTPVWRHRIQTAPGALCGDGTDMTLTATPPPGKEYKE